MDRMDEAFPVVVEPEVWGVHLWLDEDENLCCGNCKESIGWQGDSSVLHLLYLVKKHMKECIPADTRPLGVIIAEQEGNKK